jgi:hypothetical protein
MNIKELAKKSGLTESNNDGIRIETGYWDKELTRFAALVAAHEREECAKLCDHVVEGKHPDDIHSDSEWAALSLAQAIRARGTR